MQSGPNIVSFERTPVDSVPDLYVHTAAKNCAEAVTGIQRSGFQLIEPNHSVRKEVEAFAPHMTRGPTDNVISWPMSCQLPPASTDSPQSFVKL